MPTARELLEQAEALMQRDRAAMMSDGIPTLTDSVAAPDGVVPAIDVRRAPSALDDVPLLTETVEDFDTPSIPLSQVLDDELALWRETPASNAVDGAEGVTPDAAAVETPFVPEPASSSETAVETASAHAAEAPAAEIDIRPDPALLAGLPGGERQSTTLPTVDDDARWNALAEDIRMQVLQRIDIFTDTGLKDQLNQRLQPIVDRASADLVAAINQHVGQLLRAYVAEAIEREIEKWRANSR